MGFGAWHKQTRGRGGCDRQLGRQVGRQVRQQKYSRKLTILDPEIDVDLVEDVAHAEGAGLGQQGEAQARGRLVVVQLVLGGAVGDEGVVVAAELAHHVAQAEDGAEDQLGVVAALVPPRLGEGLFRRRRRRLLRWADAVGMVVVGSGSGSSSGIVSGGGNERCRGSERRCCGGLEPLLRVDALRYEEG